MSPKRTRKSPAAKRQATSRPVKRASASARRKPAPAKRKGLRRPLFWGAAAAFWLAVLGGAGLLWTARGLPDIAAADISETARTPGVLLYDRAGRRIAAHGDAFSKDLALSAMPAHLPAAVIAVEDKRFYDHFGLDPLGLARAMWVNVKARRIVQGGSTLSQQLAKNLFLTPERTLKRKAQEALLALRLEARLTKDEILELYLNRVYFGAGAYGVEAASQAYFGKSAANVSIAEAALLAGLLKAPSRLSPERDADGAAARTELVLDLMVKNGALTEQQALSAAREPIYLAADAGTPGSAHFSDWVASEARALIGRDGVPPYAVITTLDLPAQRAAEIAVAEAGPQLDRRGGGEAALIALDGAGGVRAMVGGRTYETSQFNRATSAKRQPGSAFKPFIYLTALEAGWAPWDTLEDAPVAVGDWRPDNYGDRYFGRVDLTTGLVKSANSVAVRLSQNVGVRASAMTARRLGLEDAPLAERPSLALGAMETTPLNLAAAYLPFANGGRRAEPHAILSIKDREGRTLYRRNVGAGVGPQVVDDERLAQLNAMMKRVVAEGTGRRARLAHHEAAGKTGTSTDFRDAWFVGFVADFAAAVWVGRDDNAPMEGVTGGSLPADIWSAFMERALASTAPRPLPGSPEDLRPSGRRAPEADYAADALDALIRARTQDDDPDRREGRP